MTDQKPPRLAADEREALLALLRYQRESLCRKVDGITDQAARISMVPTGTTLLWLIKHMACAEALWVMARFSGRPADVPSEDITGEDTLAAAVSVYRATSVDVDKVITSHDLDAHAAAEGELSPVNLRWILAHLLEETARHAGHADILRELIDGSTGR